MIHKHIGFSVGYNGGCFRSLNLQGYRAVPLISNPFSAPIQICSMDSAIPKSTDR